MTKEFEAIYERGVLRPLEPLPLPEGSHLDVIIVTRDSARSSGGSASTILAEIAALPLEGKSDGFSGRDHDSVLYPEKSS